MFSTMRQQKMYDYRCFSCGKEFAHRKRNKIYCSRDCYFAEKGKTKEWRAQERICLLCGESYLPSHKEQMYCGIKCFAEKKLKIDLSKSLPVECFKCGKEFLRRPSAFSEKNFCSRACTKLDPETRNCPACKEDFVVNWPGSKKRFCSKSCSRSGEFHPMYGKRFSLPEGYEPWTKGKTAETDERIAALGRKISEKIKIQYENGLRCVDGPKNPNYGITRDQRTPEQLERYSKAAAKRVQEGVLDKAHPRFLRGKHRSEKIGREIFFRSSLEKRVMVCLDADPTVLTYEYEPVQIKYDNGKRYIPDFIVSYSNGRKVLLEVKGGQYLETTATQLKAQAGQTYCHLHNLSYVVMATKDIIVLENSLGIKFSYHDLKESLKK